MTETRAGDHYDVAILGGGLAGGCLARQLRQEAPALQVLIVEKRPHPVPEAAFKVGESSVEIGAHYFQKRLGLEPHFVSKSANVPGLQIADLVARPIGRHVLNPQQPNRAFDVIKSKLNCNPIGDPHGWGLKVFP